MDEQSIEVNVAIDIEVIRKLLINDPDFINAVRLAMTKDSRALGDLYGKVAQRRQRPETIQPNTKQRVF